MNFTRAKSWLEAMKAQHPAAISWASYDGYMICPVGVAFKLAQMQGMRSTSPLSCVAGWLGVGPYAIETVAYPFASSGGAQDGNIIDIEVIDTALTNEQRHQLACVVVEAWIQSGGTKVDWWGIWNRLKLPLVPASAAHFDATEISPG